MARTKQISFKVDPQEYALIGKIVDRAAVLALREGVPFRKLETRMDLIATHANGNPLRLEDMLAADDFNLAHDVWGIARHLNRETGKLEGFFSPRFSRRQSAEA